MANIRLRKGQVDPNKPHATSVAGPATLKGTNINNVVIEGRANKSQPLEANLIIVKPNVPESRYKLGKTFKTPDGNKMVVTELFSNGMGLAEDMNGKFSGIFMLNSLTPFGDRYRSQSATEELSPSDIYWNYRTFREEDILEALEQNPNLDARPMIREEMQSAIAEVEKQILEEQQNMKYLHERPGFYDRQHKVNINRDLRWLQAAYAAAYGEGETYHYKMTKLSMVQTLDEQYMENQERKTEEFKTLMKEAVDNLSDDDLTYEDLAEYRIKAKLCKYGSSHKAEYCSDRCEYDYNKKIDNKANYYNLPEPIYQNPIRIHRN